MSMPIELSRAEELLSHLGAIVDHPLANDSDRVALSATLAGSSLQFAAATRTLCAHNLALGAATTLRSQFEALVRGVWVLHCASEHQVRRLSDCLSVESQQASKNIPLAQEMIASLEKIPQLANLLTALKEFKNSSWVPLNSFVHSGIHAVHWTKNEAPPALVEQMFRVSNGLAVLAFQALGILSGRPEVQSLLIAAATPFSDCLPPSR